jgi:hypothetical protein
MTVSQRASQIRFHSDDPVPRAWLTRKENEMQSIQTMARRLSKALAEAAAEIHPGWRRNGDGSLEKLDASAPEPPALVEWLYKTYPARAREIERIERREAAS